MKAFFRCLEQMVENKHMSSPLTDLLTSSSICRLIVGLTPQSCCWVCVPSFCWLATIVPKLKHLSVTPSHVLLYTLQTGYHYDTESSICYPTSRPFARMARAPDKPITAIGYRNFRVSSFYLPREVVFGSFGSVPVSSQAELLPVVVTAA